MSTKNSDILPRRVQGHVKKAGVRSRVPPLEDDWPRRLSITVRVREDGVIFTRTLALSMPITDRTERKKIFHACIIRDKRKTDCLMNRKGYLKVLETLSSITLPVIQPSQSPFCTMSRDILFIIEIGNPYTSQRSRFQWKNPGREASHCLEYIWGFFGRIIRERNPDVRLDDLMA